jgi:TolB protein
MVRGSLPFSYMLLTFFLFPPTHMPAQSDQSSLGIFAGHSDLGNVVHHGSSHYDPAHRSYTLTASGKNISPSSDTYQFAWKQVSGDIGLTADIDFPEKKENSHPNAVLMIRQTLDSDSPYADVALQSNGVTSLRFRDDKGAATHEIQSNVSSPHRLRIERRGDFVDIFLATTGAAMGYSGMSVRLAFPGTFYVGIGVGSRGKDVIEKAIFSNVELATPASGSEPATLHSTLETVNIVSAERRVVYTAPSHFEAPNWSHDGSYFLFNSEGHIFRLPVTGGTPVIVDTGGAVHCNNDHGISPDAHWIAISDSSQPDQKSRVSIVPISGGTPRLLTPNSPSYWHGWSPDGKTLAFVGERNGNFDIYAIPFAGGTETRLTTAQGLDDGPEYSPDGKYIYFNSERTGHMQIWRMHADGSAQEEVTFDDSNDWFPHFSPDGKWMVFLSYGSDVTGHPPNKNVQLRLMNMHDGKITTLVSLFGGQGTINVPSWAPDGKIFAFVSYRLLPADEAGIQ